jgi:phosphatidylglycerol phospholipase C
VDVKVYNDPQRLFSLMHQAISTFPNWQADLSPRILLGLWHPSFLKAAMDKVPYLKRSHIGMSPYIAREYFWDGVDAFSMNFGSLCTQEGER